MYQQLAGAAGGRSAGSQLAQLLLGFTGSGAGSLSGADGGRAAAAGAQPGPAAASISGSPGQHYLVECTLSWSSAAAASVRAIPPAVRAAIRQQLGAAIAGGGAAQVAIDGVRRDPKAGSWRMLLKVGCGGDEAAALGLVARLVGRGALELVDSATVAGLLGPVDAAAVEARLVSLGQLLELGPPADRQQQGCGREAAAGGGERAAPAAPTAPAPGSGSSSGSSELLQVAEAAAGSGSGALVDGGTGLAGERRLALPYLAYKLVDSKGRPVERPDKHPFCMSRWAAEPRS